MNIICLDMEGVLFPEIWIAVSKETGIDELKLTTRDWPDYDKLMKYRLNILKEHNLTITDIQNVISRIKPLKGAKSFISKLRENFQVVILSDTFEEFAKPLMAQLGYPTIMCNSLVISDSGEVLDYKMRIDHSKLSTVKAFQSIGYDTIAVGDSYNDLEMIKNSKAGFLFRSTDKIKKDNPNIKSCEKFNELYNLIYEASKK